MKSWNWLMIVGLISGIASISSVLVGCSAEIPARVIIAEPASDYDARAYQRRPASVVPTTDLEVQSGKAEDGNLYARIIDKKNKVLCYSVSPSGPQAVAAISCVRQ